MVSIGDATKEWLKLLSLRMQTSAIQTDINLEKDGEEENNSE